MVDDYLKKIRSIVKEEVSSSEKRVTQDIGNFINDNLLPQLEEKADKSDIQRLERKLDNFSSQVIEQNHRFSKIESIPIIAHELKAKKKKS